MERPEKVLDDLRFDFGEGDCMVEFPAQARYAELLYATRCDAVEPAQVCLHVQGEAVGGDPTRRELHTDGGDLVLPYPHAGVLRMVPAFEPVVRENPDDHAFECAEVGVGVADFEAQDRVPYYLTRTMEGRVPSPIAPENLGPQGPEVLFSGAKVPRVLRRSSYRVDRWVLAQDEGVWDLLVLPEPHEVLLEIPGFRVRCQPWTLDARDAGCWASPGVGGLFVGVVGAADQRTALDVPEAQ